MAEQRRVDRIGIDADFLELAQLVPQKSRRPYARPSDIVRRYPFLIPPGRAAVGAHISGTDSRGPVLWWSAPPGYRPKVSVEQPGAAQGFGGLIGVARSFGKPACGFCRDQDQRP